MDTSSRDVSAGGVSAGRRGARPGRLHLREGPRPDQAVAAAVARSAGRYAGPTGVPRRHPRRCWSGRRRPGVGRCAVGCLGSGSWSSPGSPSRRSTSTTTSRSTTPRASGRSTSTSTTESVKAPMIALCDALGKEFGDGEDLPALPRRAVRQGQDAVQDPPGRVRAGRPTRPAGTSRSHPAACAPAAGFYHAEAPRLAALREAIAHDTYGAELEKIIRRPGAQGVHDRRRRPQDDPARLRQGPPADRAAAAQVDHRRAGSIGFEPVIHTPKLLDLVRKDWRATRPLVEWAQRHGAH